MEKLIWLCQTINLLLLLLNLQCHFSSSFAFSANISSTHHVCLHDQRLALQEFNSTFSINPDASIACDYGSYSKTQSWKEENDCCFWDGVTCDVFSGYVIGLDLSCSWLQGSLSSNNSLFRLRHLRSLNLAYNGFYGSSISSKFGEFQSMMHLNLSYSSFSGRVPSEISFLSNMISLDLSSEEGLMLETLTLKRLVQNFTLIEKLDFSGVDMSSAATVSLMNLSSSLRYLYLEECSLQGNFPKNIFRLQNLEFLLLSAGEGLMVDLPRSNWSSPLQYLILIDMSFPFQLPESIGNLKFLKYFVLSSTNFTGTLPASIGNLTQLEVLSLSENQLTGPIPDISNLSKLTYLDLSGNNLSFTTNTDTNSTMPNLRILYLPSCNITDFPNFLRDAKDLEGLDLSNNRIRGQLPEWMWDVGVYSLIYLNLSYNCITNIVDKLPWKSLEVVDLRSNSLQGMLPVPSCTVKVFMVSSNNLTGALPSLICNASLMEVFDVSKNKLSGTVSECIRGFSRKLSVLDLRMNNFHGKIPGTFSRYNVLRTLNINGNNFEGPLPRSIASCKRLEVLDVGNNKLINDTFPDWLQPLSELQVLVLRSNKFHGSIQDCNGSQCFTKLRIFDISNNFFVGPLPAKYISNLKSMMDNKHSRGSLHYMDEGLSYQDSVSVVMKGLEYELVKILTTFVTIDFSNNMFEGDIPEAIGKLISLKGLNFSHNNLVGYIPLSVGNLSNLEWLDLSWNKLIGEIPQELAELKYLSHLNLSENKLVGSIPTGSQLVTFGNSSYEGNSGLCGFPLSKKCDDGDNDEMPDEEEHTGNELDLKIVTMGYCCGLVIGLSLGYITFSGGKPQWFVRIVEGNQAKNVKRNYRRFQGRRK